MIGRVRASRPAAAARARSGRRPWADAADAEIRAALPAPSATTNGWRSGSSGSIFPIRSAWRRASTRTPRCRTCCCGLASALSKSAPSRRCRNPAIRARGSFASRPIAASSTGWALIRKAPTPCSSVSPRAPAPAASSASMSAPTRIFADRVADYVRLIERFASVASYVTVNVSSPNTPGLRALQQAAALDDLLARVVDARERVAPNAGPTPVLLKIAPDLSLAELDDVVGIARSRRVDGMIVGNTTLARPPSLRDARMPRRPAACPAARCLRSRPACWPRPMCGWRACFR